MEADSNYFVKLIEWFFFRNILSKGKVKCNYYRWCLEKQDTNKERIK